ncbi:hypothetical protein Emed_001574 [Eimeria media]
MQLFLPASLPRVCLCYLMLEEAKRMLQRGGAIAVEVYRQVKAAVLPRQHPNTSSSSSNSSNNRSSSRSNKNSNSSNSSSSSSKSSTRYEHVFIVREG